MTSKNTALLDMPIAELVKEAYGKAEELKVSFPDISALLRTAAGRIDVFNALLVLSSSVNVQRYSPDYLMHMNHEMAYMRPSDNGTFVSMADYVALMKERNELINKLQAFKSGIGFFSYGSEHGFEQYKTTEEAIEAAEAAIDDYRGEACDGWSEEVDSICWGIVLQSSTKVGERPRTEDDSCDPAIETVCDYALLPEIEFSVTSTGEVQP